MRETRRAAFLDRDGTLIWDPGYLHEVDKVRLLDGAGRAVRQLNGAGYLVVIVTNQAGIARGLYGVADYEAVHARMLELLAAENARVDASYFCPHHPEFGGACDCRKPGLKLFRDAERDLGLDLPRSVWVGDRLSDIEPARLLGGRAFLVETGHGEAHREQARVLGVPAVRDVAAAAAEIVRAG